MTKSVFFFGDGKAEGDPKRRDLLGGKGAGLAEMCSRLPQRSQKTCSNVPRHIGMH